MADYSVEGHYDGSQIKQRRTGGYSLVTTAEDAVGRAGVISLPTAAVVTDSAGVQAHTAVPVLESGVLRLEVPASAAARLDVYTILWKATIDGELEEWETSFELVGGFILTVADLRSLDRVFESIADFPDSILAIARDAIQEVAETCGQVAFRPKGRRIKVSGDGRQQLVMPDTDLREVYSVVVDGVALLPEELALCRVDGCVVWREDGWPRGFKNIEIHYEHGYSRAPGPVRRGAMALAKEYVTPGSIPARATAAQIGENMYRVTVAGRDGFTGVPEFDAAVEQFGRVRPVVG